jgi:sulfite exporter TauE/SafE
MALTYSLAVSAFLLGLFGGFHCVAMCSGLSQIAISPRALTTADWRAEFTYLAGRVAGYSALGLAVASVGVTLTWSSQSFAMLRAIWTLANALLLVFGGLLLWTGRQPSLVNGLARQIWDWIHPKIRKFSRPGLSRPFLLGVCWGLIPCGLLWSALALAVLAPTPAAGALVMAVFALSSSGYLTLIGRLRHRLHASAIGRLGEGFGTRVGGAMLAIGAGAALWALATGLPNPLCVPMTRLVGA